MEYIITANDTETLKAGEEFAKKLNKGDIISLTGDLGAGKTVFTRGIARGLGINDIIASPTYTIVREYEGTLHLYHFDVYRVDDTDELYDIGFDEYIRGEGVCVIEWANLIEDMLPSDIIYVNISRTGDNERKITIKK